MGSWYYGIIYFREGSLNVNSESFVNGLIMGITLKESEKMSDIKTKTTYLFITSYVSGTIVRKVTIIIPVESSLIFKVYLVKERN